MRPHFFFNALNTISALMHVDVERADRMLARLGDLLRISLQINDREMATLREEMRASRLCDGITFTREFESLLRGVWRAWCERGR